MHDLHAADVVLKMALESANKHGFTKINEIEVDLGTVVEHGAEILPENLEFNIKSLARGTIAANTKVKINKVNGSQVILKAIDGDK